jgi:putative transposase
MDTVYRILTFISWLSGLCFQSLHHRFIAWTKPDTTSLLLGTLTDVSRSKSELVAENALLCQQLIILRRQVKRPACTRTDRILLVLLAKIVRSWKQALVIVQPETLLRWHRQGYKLFWRYKSRAISATPKISAETVALIKEMGYSPSRWWIIQSSLLCA